MQKHNNRAQMVIATKFTTGYNTYDSSIGILIIVGRIDELFLLVGNPNQISFSTYIATRLVEEVEDLKRGLTRHGAHELSPGSSDAHCSEA